MKLISIFIALILIGYNQNIDNKEKNNIILKDDANVNKSFVFSCGSGCALVYNLRHVKKESNVIIAEFVVTQYIDEKVADNYSELVKYVGTDNEDYKIYIEDKLVTEYANGELYLYLKKLGNEI